MLFLFQLRYTSVGVDYTKSQYQDKASRDIGDIPPSRSPGTPSKWDNDSSKLLPPIVNRAPPVEKIAIPEITKNVRALFEKGNFDDEHRPKKIVINIRDAPDGGVYENEPEHMEGVVRETDIAPDEQDVCLTAGHTKDIMDKYTRASEETPVQRAPINLAEDDGAILESQPVIRTDVVRESDHVQEDVMLERGKAKSLRDRFTNYKEAPKERKVIKLFEDDQASQVVVENTPEPVREDIIRSNPEDNAINIEAGNAKNLKGFWSSTKEYVQENKGPINVSEGQAIILESQPTVRDDVVRESDLYDGQQLNIESGSNKNLQAIWEQKQLEDAEDNRTSKQPFKLDIAPEGPVVLENEPEVRHDVCRGDTEEEVVPIQRGHIRNIAGVFRPKEEEAPRGPREMIKIERGDEECVIENEPEELMGDVIRSCDPNVVKVESGRTNTMVDYWKKTQEEEDMPKETNGNAKPKWLLEMEAAKLQAQSEVYENDPEVREDMERDECDPNEHVSVIPQGKGQSMKALWAQKMEDEEQRAKPVEVIRRKPKKPPPPPPKPPKPEPPKEKKPKARRGVDLVPVAPGKKGNPFAISLKSTKGRNKGQPEGAPASPETPPSVELGEAKTRGAMAPGQKFKASSQPMSLHSAPVVFNNENGGVTKFGPKPSCKSRSALLRK